MRRLLCMVLTGAVMIGCLCTGTGAVDESNVVSYSFETTGTAITRATGNLHYINVTTGSIDKTIEIPENGDYTLAIRNNSSKSVKVTGVVRY